MKRTCFKTAFKSQLFIFFLVFFAGGKLQAQGYIDCATLLADDDSYEYQYADAKVKGGYTYIVADVSLNDYGNDQQLPVINGESYHGTAGDGERDIYFAIFDPDCNQILGTYIGGTSDENRPALDFDDSGNIVLAWETTSADFQTTDGTTYMGNGFETDLVIAKFAPDGTLLFSTIYGGAEDAELYPSVLIDGTDTYIYGYTQSDDFPTTDGTTVNGFEDAFVLKYDGSGNLVYATVLGGSGNEEFEHAVVVNGCLYVTGQLSVTSNDFVGTDGSKYEGGFRDVLFAKYDANGNLVFSKVIGGNDIESINGGILTDGTHVYLVGNTESADFPTTDGSTHNGAGIADFFVQKYDLIGNLIFSKLYGGSKTEKMFNLAQLVNGEIYIIGESSSSDFPIIGGLPHFGSSEMILFKLDSDGNMLASTFYSGADEGPIYINNAGEVYTFGITYGGVYTTDGTGDNSGLAFVKFNADLSVCAASVTSHATLWDMEVTCFEVIGDTIYAPYLTADYFNPNISTDGSTVSNSTEGYAAGLIKFVFCPAPTPIASDVLTPNTINVCQNGLIEQINGEELTIDGSSFPPIYVDGVLQDQSDLALNYQWQVANTPTGPWTDIPGPLGQQQNYSPAPTTSDTYYRRLTSTSECCGGTVVSTSSVTSVLVSGNVAPTVDAGGTFYTCPGDAVTIGGTTTGGTPAYQYNWDDSTYLVANPIVSPTVSSIYTLLVTDANGCMQTDQATVTIYTANAGIDGDVCEGVGVTIGGTPLAGVNVVPLGSPTALEYSIAYDWSPKDGSLSCTDCPNPTAMPGTATDYTLSVTLYRPDGSSCTTSDMVSVEVFAAPSISEFAGRDTVLCLGEMAVLGISPDGLNGPYSAQATGSSTTSGTLTISELSDGDFSTGVKTNDGTSETVILNLGSVYTINTIEMSIHSSTYWDSDYTIETSTDGTNYNTLFSDVRYTSSAGTTVRQNAISVLTFPEQAVQYFRFVPESATSDVGISEFSVKNQPYTYIWTPGDYIAVDNSYATFDAGNLEMPSTNPITYTVTANQGTCNFYDQTTVAVIESRAGEDACGPRYVGEEDRTPNIEETYSWAKITDSGITTGTGDFLTVTDEAIVPVSASTGGDVGYELTVSYTLPSGVTGVCKDTVIVPPLCGVDCDVEPYGGGCLDFADGNAGLMGISPDNTDLSLWTISWTSNEGMVGLDNYDSQIVYLTDDVTRTYTVTFTSVLDPTYNCSDVIEANSPGFSTPVIDATGGTVCKGDSINIGDPAMNPGLTYSWTNDQFLNDPSDSYPKASPDITTEFIITVVDNSTGCEAMDTIIVIVPSGAKAGPDLAVCDNGTVTIGASTDTLGFTYSWEPMGAAWEPGYDHTDAIPEVFVAITTEFILTATDTSGTCVSKDTMMVFVDNLPPVFTLPDLSYCPSSATPLYLGTSDGTLGTNLVPDSTGYTFLWFPSTVSDATAMNPSVNTLPTTPTTYEVEVRTPNGGCNQIATQKIIPTVSKALVGGNQSTCLGESVQIGDDANPTSGGETYSWSPATDLDDATSPNPTFTSSATGSFTYILTKDIGGCLTTSEVTITVTGPTAPALSPQTICEGESVQIGVNNNASLAYSWSPTSDLEDPYISNPTFSGTSTTNYTLTVIDGNGCKAEVGTSVTVNPAPAITITLPDTTLCDDSATSIVINTGVAPAGSYAYQWSPSTFLDNANALNPTFFIPGEGVYEYIIEVIDQGTGCSIFDTTIINVNLNNIPEVVAFAIQPSCVDNNPQADGYLQISSVSVGTHYSYSMGNTFTGSNNINDATSFNYNTDLPLKFGSLTNPSGSQDYTIRVFNGASDCFTDVVVTMNEQDCTVGCDCEDMIYLNDVTYNDVHKFSINENTGAVTEIGNPWLPAGIINQPHGLVSDNNGNLYINYGADNGTLYQLNCDGDILDNNFASIAHQVFNLGSRDGVIYVHNNNGNYIEAFSTCDGSSLGKMWVDNGNNTFAWGFFIDDNNWYLPDIISGNIFSGSLDTDLYSSTPSNTGTALFNTGYTAPDQSYFSDVAVSMTRDVNGNSYVVINQIANVLGGLSDVTILKFSPTGTLITSINDNMGTPNGTNGQSGFDGGRGIVYSSMSNYLYFGNYENCITVFDTSLVEQTSLNIGNPSSGLPKGLSINTECCPTNNNQVIDTTLCAVSINDTIFLQDLINCEGTICEGLWQVEGGNIGLTYYACNNSITIDALNACGSFTLESDGTGNNPQCGAFKITVNISIANLSITAAQTNCTDNGDGTYTTAYDVQVDWASSTCNYDEMINVTHNGIVIGTIDANTATSPSTFNVSIAADGNGTQLFKAEYTGDSGCPADSLNFKTPLPCPADVGDCSSTTGCLGGIAFEDFNCNGTDEASEAGIQGIQVVIYDCTNTAVDTVWTDSNGDWQLCGLTDGEAYRVEFILPESIACWASPTHAGGDNGTDVQFLTAPACTKFGLSSPKDYCEGDPYIIIPCFSDGAYDGGNSGEAAIVKLLESADGHDFTGTTKTGDYEAMTLATHNDVGAVYGVAWQPTKGSYYLSSFHKRYVGYGPDGPDAIYQYDLAGNKIGTINLDALLAGSNTAGSDVHDFTPAGGGDPHPGEVYDLGTGDEVFDGVGKLSFGDIEMSDNDSLLYVVNLFDKKIYALDVSSGNAGSVSIAQTWDAPDATGAGQHRPFALAMHQGKLWVGSVNEDGSNAYVHSILPGGTVFNLELTIPLGYDRQAYINDAYDPNSLSNWNAWATTADVPYGGITGGALLEIGYPQPILSDIEFADNGDMILGFRDRFGDQSGAGRFLHPDETQETFSISAGDILKACFLSGNYVLETAAGGCAGAGGISPSGPGGTEFYSWDFYNYEDPWSPIKPDPSVGGYVSGGVHWETTQGALLQIKGNPYIITTAMDPFSDYSGGLLKLNNTTGGREGVSIDSANLADLVGGYTLYETGEYPPALGGISFGKANGLGDLEAACAPAPLEIGNYVWCDSIVNGIQDACEQGIEDMIVQLYDEDGLLVGQDTTENGNYYFNQYNVDSTGITVDGSGVATPATSWSGMQYSTKYYIVFGDGQYDNGNEIFTIGSETYQGPTTVDVGTNDNIDSDVDGGTLSTAIGSMPANLPVICMTTDAIGCGNHRYDFGILCEPCDEIENLITERTICSGELVDTISVTTTFNNPDSIAFVYFTTAQTNPTSIYTGGTGIDTVQIASSNDTVRLLNTSGFTNNNADNTPDTFFVYAIAHPTPSPSDCRPYQEIKIIVNACDWGDLPDVTAGTNLDDYQTTSANNGPVHVITLGLSLGSVVDGEADGQPSTNALGDGADEDGLTIFPTLDISPGSTFRLPLDYTNTTGMDAHIEAWIDWNGNGEFDAGEMIYDEVNTTDTYIEVTTPANAVTGEFLGVRIRISNEDNMTPYGRIESGEVEDYLIGLDCKTQICIPIENSVIRE